MFQSSDAPSFVNAQPGHCIRRLQQVAVALFMEETAEFGITPVQFATLMTAHEHPGLDQRSLAARISFDTSTIGGVIDRLEKRGLILRNAAPHDRRLRLLTVTAEGEHLLEQALPRVRAAQQRILAPLGGEDEQRAFLQQMQRVVEAHHDHVQGERDSD